MSASDASTGKPSRQRKQAGKRSLSAAPLPRPGVASGKKPKKPPSESPQTATARSVSVICDAMRRTQWWETVSRLVQMKRQSREVHALQCLGIGSFVNSSNARHQLACAVLLKELLDEPGVCSVTDPAMEDDDEQIARQLGFQVVQAQQYELKPPANGKCTVLFMPHCDFGLNESTLRAAKKFNFEAVIFFANEFSKYITNVASSSRRRADSLIGKLYAGGVLNEHPCPNPILSTSETAFNDLAVTTVTS